MAQITTGQLTAILYKLEQTLWAKASLISTSRDHEITYAEKALYLDHLVDELNRHFKTKKAKSEKKIEDVECKFNLWAIQQAYPPTLHSKEFVKMWMPFLQKDIQTEEDYQACLAAVKNYREHRLKEESILSTNRKFTKRFSNWVKEWRGWIPQASDKPVAKVLDASEVGY